MQKDPAERTEEEIRAALEFEKKEAAFLEEREKLKKALDGELRKLLSSIAHAMDSFDERLRKLFDLKINTEMVMHQVGTPYAFVAVCIGVCVCVCVVCVCVGAAEGSGAGECTAGRGRGGGKRKTAQRSTTRKEKSEGIYICAYIYTHTHEMLVYSKSVVEVLLVFTGPQSQLAGVVNTAKNKIEEYRELYDQMLADDKTLDRNFKRDFSDCEPFVDQLYKLFKRRPRQAQTREKNAVFILILQGTEVEARSQ